MEQAEEPSQPVAQMLAVMKLQMVLKHKDFHPSTVVINQIFSETIRGIEKSSDCNTLITMMAIQECLTAFLSGVISASAVLLTKDLPEKSYEGSSLEETQLFIADLLSEAFDKTQSERARKLLSEARNQLG